MKQSVQISGAPPAHESMDFSRLLEEGIRLAQQLSGELWTDYNEHDPGVTILEQLCYALTDLGYRSNYDIEDILAPAPDAKEKPPHTLYTGDQILSCRPLTVKDYRKLLYDQILGLKNVWLKKPDPDETGGIKGLYEVLVDIYDDARHLDQQKRDLHKKRILFEVNSLLYANRNLTEDIHRVVILEPKDFGVEATIEIGTEASPEGILAQIIYNIENYLVPYPIVSSVDRQMEQDVPPDDLFAGPLLQHGIIDDDTLADLPDVIKIKDIERIIAGIKGIENIETLRLQGRGKDTEILIHLDGRVPHLQRDASKITLIRAGSPYPIDPIRLERKLKALTEAHRQRELTARKKMRDEAYRKLPQGTYKAIDNYHSIQHHFPLTYGIGGYGIPEPLLYEAGPYSRIANPWGMRKKREAQARQLKAYLLLFEQVLANAFSQLAHTPQLFSLDRGLRQTYFAQPITHVPDTAPILAQAHRNLSLSDLKEDMVVEVEGQRQEGRIMARHIRTRDRATDAHFSVAGAIEEVDYRTQSLTVYDEPFVWTDLTRISDEDGQTRTAETLVEGQGVVVEARRETPASTAFRIHLKSDLTEDAFKIKAIGTLGPASFDEADNTALTVNEVSFTVAHVPPEGMYRVKVINVIDAIDDEGALRVGDITFMRLPTTTVRQEGLDLAPGMMVEIDGRSGERLAVRVQVRPADTPSTFGTLGPIADLLKDESGAVHSLTMHPYTFRFFDKTEIVDEDGNPWPRENLAIGTKVEIQSRKNQVVAEHVQTRDPDIQTTFVITSLAPAITDDVLDRLLTAQTDFESAAQTFQQAQAEHTAEPDDRDKKKAFQEAKKAFKKATKTFQKSADSLKKTHGNAPIRVEGLTQIDDEEGLEIYRRTLQQLVARFDPFLDRRGRMLDHLLARFNERFDDYLLDLLDTRPSGKKDPFYEELIQSKITFLEQYIDLSQERGAGVNFFSPYRLHITNKDVPDAAYNPGYRFTLHSYGIESETRQARCREEIIEYGANKLNYRIMYARRPRVAVFLVDSQAMPIAYGWIDPLTSEAHAILKEDDALDKAADVLTTFFEQLKTDPDLRQTCVLDYLPDDDWSDQPPKPTPPADWPRTSGLEYRARLLLGIDNRTRWPLAPSRDTSIYKDTLQEGDVPVEAFHLIGPETAVAPGWEALKEAVNFSFQPLDPTKQHILKHILKHGTQKRHYSVEEGPDERFQVRFAPPAADPALEAPPPHVVYRTGSRKQAHEALDNLVAYLNGLSRQMEGFYILEHILLRPAPEPPPEMRYDILILDDDARIRLSSYDLPNAAARDQRLKDILLYGATESFYDLTKNARGEINLILRDDKQRKIANGEEEFPTQETAEQGIKNLARLIGSISHEEDRPDPHVQIREKQIDRTDAAGALAASEGRFGIRILDATKRIRLRIYNLPDEAARTQRLDDILLFGSREDTYKAIEQDNGEINLILYDDTGYLLAYGVEEYPTPEAAQKGIKDLAYEIWQLCLDETLHEKHVQLIPEILPPPPPTEPDDPDFYNFKISVFFPDWPARFQSTDFQLFAERVIRENAPAHVAIKAHWLNVEDMQTFEDLYGRWVKAKTWRLTDMFDQQTNAAPVVQEAMDDLKKRFYALLRLTRLKAGQRLYDEAGIVAAKALEAARKVRQRLESEPGTSPVERAAWDAEIDQIGHAMQLIDFIIAELGDQPRRSRSAPQSLTERVLAFFNTVSSPEEIVQRIQDDPLRGSASSKAYGIRPALARRILETRASLPEERFTSIEQLDAIRGIGPATLNDILNAFREEDLAAPPEPLPDEYPESVNDLANQLKQFIKNLG